MFARVPASQQVCTTYTNLTHTNRIFLQESYISKTWRRSVRSNICYALRAGTFFSDSDEVWDAEVAAADVGNAPASSPVLPSRGVHIGCIASATVCRISALQRQSTDASIDRWHQQTSECLGRCVKLGCLQQHASLLVRTVPALPTC